MVTLSCDVCGAAVPSVRNRSRYCSAACRQRAYRQRNGKVSAAFPARLDSFVGRRREFAEVGRLLRYETRLLTLTGPPGVGKTRLALEVGAAAHRTWQSDTVLVELGTVETGERVVEMVTEAVRGRNLLLVLDNCEHVLDTCAPLIEKLLGAHPGLRVLATSRQALGLAGEATFPVDGLGDDASRLFAERAQGTVHDFKLTDANRELVATVCERLDGLPLEIELTVRLLRVLPLAEIANRLPDRLSMLVLGSRTAEPRHGSLRAAIAWSYERLSEQGRETYRRLSALPGGFGPELVEQLCGPGATLHELVANSLVIPGRRFRMLESIRLYGYERLAESGELAEVRGRLLDWFTDLAAPLLDTAIGPAWRLDVLSQECDNLDHLARESPHLMHATALSLARLRLGQQGDSMALLADAVGRAGPDSEWYTVALAAQSLLEARWGDQDEAVRIASRAVALEQPRARPPVRFRAHLALGLAWVRRGQAEGAVTELGECLRIARGIGDDLDTAIAACNLAWACVFTGDFDRAAVLLDEALPVCRAHAVPWQLASALHTAGTVALARGNTKAARSLFVEAYRAGYFTADTTGYFLEAMGVVASMERRPERALRLIAAAGDTRSEPQWREWICSAVQDARELLPPAQAQAAFAEGRSLDEESAMRYALGDVWPKCGAAGAVSSLPRRERRVLSLMAQGLTNRQIADNLQVSLRTVEASVRAARITLGVRSRAQLAALAGDHLVAED